jgi:hypothetical protein
LKKLLISIFLALGSLYSGAQGFNKELEYFIDKDPGLGKGTPISITAADTLIKTFEISVDTFKSGFHQVHVRIKGKNGLWTPYQFFQFTIEDTATQGAVTELEYFYDKDTVVGSMTKVSITAKDTLATIIQRDVSQLSTGQHFMHVRAKNRKGNWSPFQYAQFIIVDTVTQGQVSELEYFFDKDTTVGKMNKVTISKSDTLKTQIQPDVSQLSIGQHFMHVRVKNTKGNWSPFQFAQFVLEDTATQGKINILEYFIDKDSVVGGMKQVKITPSDTLFNTIRYDVNGLSSGQHFMHVRVKNSKGNWSPFQFHPFIVEDTVAKANIKISKIETVIDTSLHTQSRIQITKYNPAVDSVNQILIQPVDTGLTLLKPHYLRIWAQNNTGLTTPWLKDTFVVIDCPMLDTAAFKIAGTFCAGNSISFKQDITKFGIWSVDSFNFQWYINDCCTTSSTKDSFTNKFTNAGTYDVRLSFQKKSESRCKGSLTQTISIGRSYNDTLTIKTCDNDSVKIHGVFRKTAGLYPLKTKSILGCDSISVVNLKVNKTFNTASQRSICNGDSSFIFGAWKKTAGLYTNKLKTINGCDSIINITLSVNPKYTLKDSFTICNSDSISTHGKKFKTAGTFVTTLKTKQNCDSIYITIIKVNPSYQLKDSFTICSGDSVLTHGKKFKNAGTFTTSFKTKRNCDSSYFTTIRINPVYNLKDTFTICNGDSIVKHGKKFKTAGTFTTPFKTRKNCDSIYNTLIRVNPVYNLKDSFTICNGDSLKTHGKTFKTAGTFTIPFKTKNGCDSIYQTKIKVNPSYQLADNFTLCNGDSISIHGKIFKKQGVFTTAFKTKNSCDSIYTTTIKVNPVYNLNDTFTICQNDSVTKHGKVFKVAGVFKTTFKTKASCDSIYFTKINVNPVYQLKDSFVICSGDSVIKHGKIFKSAGSFNSAFFTRKGCDSIYTTKIIVNPSYNLTRIVGLCGGDSVLFDSKYRNKTGTYIGRFKTRKNCDSIITLQLTVDNIINVSQQIAICAGDSLLLNGRFVKKAGLFTDTLTARLGCDSIVKTTLVVNPNKQTDLQAKICASDSILFGGKFLKVAGNYKQVLKTSKLCDSTVNLSLSIFPKVLTTINVKICAGDSVFTGNRFKKTAGVFTDVLKAKNACDSFVETTVAILQKSSGSENFLICFNDSIRINGKFEKRAGTYNFKVKNKVGCDSSVTINLSVRPPADLKIVATGFATLSTNKPFVSYQWLRDEVIIPGATQRSIVANKAGIYDVAIVDSLGCKLSTIDLRALGITEKIYEGNYLVYPNPASQFLNIVSDTKSPFAYKLVNQVGLIISIGKSDAGEQILNTQLLADGIYYLYLQEHNRLFYYKVLISK